MHIVPSKPKFVGNFSIPSRVLEKYEFPSLIRCGCLLFTNMSFKCENMKVVLGQIWMIIPTCTSVNQLFAEVTSHFILSLLVFTCKYKPHEGMSGHQNIAVCENMEKTF